MKNEYRDIEYCNDCKILSSPRFPCACKQEELVKDIIEKVGNNEN